MMAGTSVVLLIAVGIYQLTPLKYACLRHCRSPLFFISHHWSPGRGDVGSFLLSRVLSLFLASGPRR
jgi:predicted metal-binding membrane protein